MYDAWQLVRVSGGRWVASCCNKWARWWHGTGGGKCRLQTGGWLDTATRDTTLRLWVVTALQMVV